MGIGSVSFEEFYKLFKRSNPNVRYTPEDKERGFTLDRICATDLIMEAPHHRNATLDQVKEAISEKESIAVKDKKLDKTVIFIGAVGEGKNCYFEVWYNRDIKKYFKP